MATYTIEYTWPPSEEDQEYMDYLDNFSDDLPGGYSLGMLIYKADPIAFYTGKEDWLSEKEDEDEDSEDEDEDSEDEDEDSESEATDDA